MNVVYSILSALMPVLLAVAQDQQAEGATVGSADAASVWSCAQGSSRSAQETCAYQKRVDAIAARESGLPLDSLVGIYAYGNAFQGIVIALDGDGWAGVREWSDVGSPAPIAGHYRLQDGQLVVELERALAYAPDVKQLRYYPLHWGERLFLLGSDELGDIVSILNSDGLDNEIFQTMREKLERVRTRDQSLCGTPDLPAQWNAHLHPVPLQVVLAAARVESRRSKETRKYRVEFAAGRRQGLFAGMSLQGTAQQFPHARVWTKVERVEDDHATGWLSLAAADRLHPIDAVRIEKGVELVSGKGWSEMDCVPPR